MRSGPPLSTSLRRRMRRIGRPLSGQANSNALWLPPDRFGLTRLEIICPPLHHQPSMCEVSRGVYRWIFTEAQCLFLAAEGIFEPPELRSAGPDAQVKPLPVEEFIVPCAPRRIFDFEVFESHWVSPVWGTGKKCPVPAPESNRCRRIQANRDGQKQRRMDAANRCFY